jgi:Spy/CpxP family protein refolding chaperone
MALCSIAIAAGIVGVVAIVKRLVFRRRFGHLAFAGGPCGGAGFGGGGYGGDFEGRSCGGGGSRWWGGGGRGWGRFGGHRGGIGGSFWLRALFARLDTTPGQEREIRAAIEEMQERARNAKGDLPEVRANIAKAMVGDTFDTAAFEAVSARVDATGEKMKDAFGSALKRIHAVLDPRQRERFADIVGKGGLFGRWGRGGPKSGDGPYRDGADL